MSQQRHRGPHPEDPRLFSERAVARLRVAGEEVAWLLERGYPLASVIAFVGGRHQLDARQRLAVQRAACAPSQAADRRRRALAKEDVRGRTLLVDGLNVVITLEVALSGGVVLVGADGALRDLAGLRGTYRIVDETASAVALLGATLGELGAAGATFLFDAPVSNSGRLRALVEDHARSWAFPIEASVVPSPDRALAGGEAVVSSDAVVIDAAVSWANVAAWVVERHVPRAWLVRIFA